MTTLAWPSTACFYSGNEKMFKAAHDQSHYSTDYATKWHASVGELLPSIALGLDNLRAPPVVESETDGNLVINDVNVELHEASGDAESPVSL